MVTPNGPPPPPSPHPHPLPLIIDRTHNLNHWRSNPFTMARRLAAQKANQRTITLSNNHA